MLNPSARYIPVQNHGGPISGPVGLVVHVQEGDGSLAGWFNNPASGVSSHFWVSKAGNLEQYVDTSLRAWAQAAGNAAYLSVETEGLHSEALTDPQLKTLGALWAWVRGEYPAIPDRLVDHGAAGLTTHAFYPSGLPDPAWGGHPCPGSIRAGQLPAIIGTAPQPGADEEMQIAAHPSKQGYWIAKPDGAVFAKGAAIYYGGGYPAGSPKPQVPQTQAEMSSPCTGIASTPTGLGYWLVDAEGHIYSFGDATWLGNSA